MMAQCTTDALAFQTVAGREVVAQFDGGTLTSDGGALLLRETDQRVGAVCGVLYGSSGSRARYARGRGARAAARVRARPRVRGLE